MRISHKTLYRALQVPHPGIRWTCLTTDLRKRQTRCRPRGRVENNGRLKAKVSMEPMPTEHQRERQRLASTIPSRSSQSHQHDRIGDEADRRGDQRSPAPSALLENPRRGLGTIRCADRLRPPGASHRFQSDVNATCHTGTRDQSPHGGIYPETFMIIQG